MTSTKIVLTGGPAAGKSEAINYLRKQFTSRGYRVITLHETATDMILDGLIPNETLISFDFQNSLFEMQLFRENLYEKAMKCMEKKKTLVICDRGIMDGKVFLKEGEFEEIMSRHGVDKPSLLKRYDAIFHLHTSASLGPDYYTLENNQARSEDWKTALEQDQALIDSWSPHPCHYEIAAQIHLEDKLHALDQAVLDFLEMNK